MYKRILSIILVMLMCLLLFPLSAVASGSVNATYANGVVTVVGTGFTSGTSYTVRVVDTVNSQIKAMGQTMADGSGNISASITTGVLGTLGNYIVYINNPDGTLVGTDTSVEESSMLYTATIQAGTGGRITSGTSGSYAVGDTITLEASANSGYTFDKWTSSGGGKYENAYSASTTFIMPAANVTITANFTYTGGGGSVETPAPIPTPTPEPDITEDGNVTTVSTLVKTTTDPTTGVVTANVEASVFSSLIDGAKEAEDSKQKAIVEIKVDVATDTKSVEVIIPGDVFKQAADTTEADVKVDAGLGIITFDDRAVEYISGTANTENISISIEKIDTFTLPQEAREKVGDRPVFDFSVRAGDTEISQFGGGKAKISIPYTPKAGENENAIIVYYIDNDGKLQTARGRYDAETGTVNFSTNHFSWYAVGYNEVTFKDVASSSWYADAVGFIAAREITKGTGDGNYSPKEMLTRGQFIVMVLRAYEIEPDDNPVDNFADAGNTYYTNYLAAAKRLGISKGIGNNLYAPDNEITRQEMFTLLYNTLKVIDELPGSTDGKSLSSFRDADQIASWAKEAMTLFTRTGIIRGNGGGELLPVGTATRAEMAQVLYNILSK